MPQTSLIPASRFAPFTSAAICCASALVAFVAWILVDASFNVILELLLIDAGLRPDAVLALQSEQGWARFAARLVVFGGLALIAILGMTVVCVRAFFGRPKERSISSLLILITLVAGWLGLFVGYEDLRWHGFRYRLRRQMPALQLTANKLSRAWPENDGYLPGVGKYCHDRAKQRILIVDSNGQSFPMVETVGNFVRRTRRGNICFHLQSRPEQMLEFYPHGGSPVSYVDEFNGWPVEHELLREEQLGRDVYLTTYCMTSASHDE